MFLFSCYEQLRRLWCEGKHILGIPRDEIPNLHSCLLNQQLQVINCCISRKQRRARISPYGDIHPESHARICSGELVLRLGVDKRLENTRLLDTGEPVYAPVLQVL